jgi:homoserine O-acetyltransferase
MIMPLHFLHDALFVLESGKTLERLEIAYTTYGQLNEAKDNVIWVCHALTANSEVADWWPGMVGSGCAFDLDTKFIVCANIIGSCYGSTGPLSINPVTGVSYYHDFPMLTVRDMVNAYVLLRKHLGIPNIALLAGGSMGGYQVLEWAMIEPNVIKSLFLIATSPAESAWGIAIHTAQRMAIEADENWTTNDAKAGSKGLRAARAIGMLTYRGYEQMVEEQTDGDAEKLNDYKAELYIRYQGEKLVKRFNAYSYWHLTKAMDSHNVSRGRGGVLSEVLQQITQPCLLLGISTDMLCPIQEQEYMAKHMPNCSYTAISSPYGHDGFLIEVEQITDLLSEWTDAQKILIKKQA